MHRHGKIDSNQKLIVRSLRDIGATVESLADLGEGKPDILVGFRGKNFLFEIKKDEKEKLTIEQEKWHNHWVGTVYIIYNFNQAMEILIRGY